MSSRAIHIEMLDDLTTDAFINALHAFIAIRGNIRQLRCDQGTNFVGAKRVPKCNERPRSGKGETIWMRAPNGYPIIRLHGGCMGETN